MKNFILLFCLTAISFIATAQNPLPCSTGNCSVSSELDICSGNPASLVSTFRNGQLYFAGNGCTDGLCAGSVWRFADIANGKIINATITIDVVVNAKLEKIDDDAAVDQFGGSVQSLFAPSIQSNTDLNGIDRKGYVQFTIRFFTAGIGDGYSLLTNLSSLNVLNYDIDGNNAGNIISGKTGSWYRESVYLKEIEKDNPSINLDQTTELCNHKYADTDSWLGSMSALCDRTGMAKCNQLAMAGRFANPQHSITFRLGYDYNAGGNIGRPSSQFGIKLSCFDFLSGTQLPVNLYDFTAKKIDNVVHLDWSTTYETYNQGFRIQRKTANDDFVDVGFLPSHAPDGNSQIKLFYHYADLNTNKGISQYRILQSDLQGNSRVSEIRSIMGTGQENSVVIYPNPGTNGKVNIVFEDSKTGKEIVINNFWGRVVKQWRQVSGNTITAENLLPGIYTVRIVDRQTGDIKMEKFVIGQ